MLNRLRPVLLLLGVVCATAGTPATARAAAERPCVGAAARDPQRPCPVIPDRFKASPSPEVAPLVPNAPCEPIRSRTEPKTCWFGHPRARAAATVALVGDSHAPAWRAAVEVAAREKRWRGITIRRSSCPFSFASPSADDPRGAECSAWVRQTVKWFKRHRDVRTAFVANSSFYSVPVPAGGDSFSAAVTGFRDAFAALPASVRQIVVLRDSPRARIGSMDCIANALKLRQRPDLRCGVPRAEALTPDPAVQAALELNRARVQVIDLTPFFCDETTCQTVIGGLTVHKDPSHLGAPFAATLGPYLLAAYNRLTPPS